MTESDNNKDQLTDSGQEPQIDIEEFLGVLWSGKKLIIMTTLLFAIASVIYALSLQNIYKSEAILSLAEGQASQNSSLSKYSGLASMAGIDLPSAGQNKGALVIETVRSRDFLKHLLTFNQVLPSLMAPKDFDVKSSVLFFDEEVYSFESKKWNRKVKAPFKPKPSPLESHEEYIKNVLEIGQNKKTQFITIAIKHISPVFAKEFLDLIIVELNTTLRQKDLVESSQALNYLQEQSVKTTNLGVKNSINSLIKRQLEIKMMANIREDYVVELIETPFQPEKKFEPKRAIICIMITSLGGLLSIIWVLISNYFFNNSIGAFLTRKSEL